MFHALFARKVAQNSTQLEIKHSAIHGRGVFCNKKIKRGRMIEKAPLICISKEDADILKQSCLYDYYFLLNDPVNPLALGLGYSSLYNHSCFANAMYSINLAKKLIVIKACRDIVPGEEITINYNGQPQDQNPVIFSNAVPAI